ncbi:hypothetical protein ACP70R_002542 [Stipagrostis hirtigluma subsp. patula]
MKAHVPRRSRPAKGKLHRDRRLTSPIVADNNLAADVDVIVATKLLAVDIANNDLAADGSAHVHKVEVIVDAAAVISLQAVNLDVVIDPAARRCRRPTPWIIALTAVLPRSAP